MQNIVLFDYQKEIVKWVQEVFRRSQSVMVQMPTGTGKTIVLANIVSSFLEKDKRDVWVVAHRRELVSQIEETFSKVCVDASDILSRVKVMSIQWLSMHYQEMKEVPSLIVIDEAHHAVASTYAEVLRAFPNAKKLGLTATPYRLNGKGFTDLFDVLLTSWSMERFIAKGRLSLYDYYSIKPDSADQQLVDSLQKRGADGDYQLKEMNEVMDVRPSLERLYMNIKQYVPEKKGIVYAISIAHAEHIAEFYRENGVNAVAISSKTPLDERKAQIEQFKNGEIQVLVSVDLFSEGFDCPDVEFIQLARPTLSLSKYLQMVGRGLRVAEDKEYCVILDNVGLYRMFGLPSADRDWQRMFEGKNELDFLLHDVCMRINQNYCRWETITNNGDKMTKILGHDQQARMIGDGCEDEIVEEKNGWIDQWSGLRFTKRPQIVRLLGIELCTEDCKRFYPRCHSKCIDDKSYINLKTLELQVGRGINWKRKFIPMDEPNKVYQLKEKSGSVRLFVDDMNNLYVQGNTSMALTRVNTQEEIDMYCHRYREGENVARKAHDNQYKHGRMFPLYELDDMSSGSIRRDGDDIWFIDHDTYGESYWVDGMNGMKHYSKPIVMQRGFVNIIKDGDWYYVRNIPDLTSRPFRNWEIVADENICVIDNEFLFLKQEPRLWYKIFKRTDDFSYFIVKEHRASYKNYIGIHDIIITQSDLSGLSMEKDGVPYTPYFQPVRKAEREY